MSTGHVGPSTSPQRAQFTNGYLPVAPFEHTEPTAVGVVDLESAAMAPVLPPTNQPPRDALLLVRLHGEPLGFVYLPDADAAGDAEAVRARAAHELDPAIRDHERRFGCRASDADCPGAAPPALPGSAAVIIPTGARVTQLERCLRSLLPAVPPDVEVLVVDNRPGELGTCQLVEQWSGRDKRVRYLAEHRPGSSVARNRGISQTAAEFVAFTDDDVVVDRGWLGWLLSPFRDPQVTAATGLVLPLELATIAQKRFERYAGFSKGLRRQAYDLSANRARDRLLYPYWGGMFGSGNSMAFRREELRAAGGFDPALGAGSLALAGADIDAMSAAILRGGTLVYEPRSLCWHEHRRDDAALARQVFNYGAGFTAILTKALVTDFRFAAAVARSVPIAVKHRRRRRDEVKSASATALPEDLASLQRQGMLRGPLLYGRSVRWVRRLGLHRVIHGL